MLVLLKRSKKTVRKVAKILFGRSAADKRSLEKSLKFALLRPEKEIFRAEF